MVTTRFIAALPTLLQDDQSLCVEGLETHMDEQWRAGIAGLLVAGTMGLMQLLTDDTYRDLVKHAARFGAGRGELMIGVGDTSLARTRDRIRYVEQFDIDAVVILAPFLLTFSQSDLIYYFKSLADLSRKPVYLYDLPQITKTKLQIPTVLELSRHPNVHGIKCSDEWAWTRQLIDQLDAGFRVIPAQPMLVDQLIRCGVRENLDGMYAVAPQWTVGIAQAAERGQWALASRRQQRLAGLLAMLRERYPLFPAVAAMLNARGIRGTCAPAPMQPLNDQVRQQLLDEPLVQALLSGRDVDPDALPHEPVEAARPGAVRL